MSSRRIAKVNELIKREFSEALSKDIAGNPGIFSTVSKVDTSNDLKYAKVFISIFPQDKAQAGFEFLKKQRGAIEKRIFKRLSMKIVPKLILVLDETEEYAEEVERLLGEIKREDTYDANDEESSREKGLS